MFMNSLKKILVIATATTLTSLIPLKAKAVVFSPDTGHYYNFVSADITWEEAKVAAESLSYKGLQGYLAAITSQTEQDFIVDNLGVPTVDGHHSGWIGASDAETEGTLKWVTSPEAGTVFWQNSSEIGYNNFLNTEPNNFPHISTGEDYVIMLVSGHWADTTNYPPFGRSSGFFVEYGGIESPKSKSVPEPSLALSLLALSTLGLLLTKGKKYSGVRKTSLFSIVAVVVSLLFNASLVKAQQLPKSNNESVIDVLWYGQNSIYNQRISSLGEAASYYDPWGDGTLDWNLTFWNPGDSTPDFSQYDALVIGSSFPSLYGFDSSRLLNSKEAIEKARGNRTFLSGQDADIHYILTHGFRPDGPFGFLVNAVNWAGSGTGLGVVSLPDASISARHRVNRWLLQENSFLKDELEGYRSFFNEESVLIPTATSDFPVNEGLTTIGLSNWRRSSHIGFRKDIPGYVSINDAGNYPGWAVTIVTASEADGSTGGSQQVPESSSFTSLLALSTLGFLFTKGKKKLTNLK